MPHHLHDGPPADLRITNNRFARPKPRASLAALQWAAERAGQSYGRFTLNLTDADQAAIQEQYEAIQAEERRKMRVDISI